MSDAVLDDEMLQVNGGEDYSRPKPRPTKRAKTNRAAAFFDELNRTIRGVEASFANLVSSIVPWLSPIPAAYMTFQHTSDPETLAFPFLVAVCVAIVVEGLGFSAVSTAVSFWGKLSRIRLIKKNNPDAPINTDTRDMSIYLIIAILTFIVYLAIILSVNVLMELDDSTLFVLIVRGLLTSLSVPAAIIVAIRSQVHGQLEGFEEDLADAMRIQAETQRLQADAEISAKRAQLELEMTAERNRQEMEIAQERFRQELLANRREERREFELRKLELENTTGVQSVQLNKLNRQTNRVSPMTQKVFDFLNSAYVGGEPVPGPRDIERATGVSVGTASTARSTWMTQNGLVDGEGPVQ